MLAKRYHSQSLAEHSRAAGRRYIVESGQPGRAGQQRLAINVNHGPNCFLILCARKASLLKIFMRKLIQVDNLMRRVSTSLMRTAIVRALITHAIGRSRAEAESDTAALLETITRARNHREIA